MMLLGACAHSPSDGDAAPQMRKIENFANKTAPQLYADLIEPGVFELINDYDSEGYRVVSGNVRMKDDSRGYLIDVRSPDGSHFALMRRADGEGVSRVSKNGERTFTPLPPRSGQPLRDDAVAGVVEKTLAGPRKPEKSASPRAPVTIHVFAAYTRNAVDSKYVGADLNADARARLETVNLSLRNAGINIISLSLSKAVIFESNPQISSQTLDNMELWFGTPARESGADLIALFAGKDSHVGDRNGIARLGGRLSISSVTNNWVFAHEIGHNVGGGHCLGDQPNYKNGYDQGVLCLDNEFWYSGLIGWEPGKPVRGNWLHADMARTWLEEKYRLASYTPPYPPPPEFYELAPENFRAVPGPNSIHFFWDPVPGAVKYTVFKRLGIPPAVGTPTTANFLLEGRQAGAGIYSVEAIDAKGQLSGRSVYLTTGPLE